MLKGVIFASETMDSKCLTICDATVPEALCSRVGIMAHGRFVALGTVQHLKSKFLDGYTVEINCKPNTSELVVDQLVSELLTKTLPGSTVAERHGRFVTLDVPRISSIGLGVCFKRLQALKDRIDSTVENYSMSQCSLEQVFIKLVKDANDSEFGPGLLEETAMNTN
jgi:ABC-type multidrug transport system ATPase subunit